MKNAILVVVLVSANLACNSSNPAVTPPVTKTLTALSITGGAGLVAPGSSLALAAITSWSDGTSAPALTGVTWSVDANATVSAAGLVTGIKPGTAQVTASFTDAGITRRATVVLTVTAAALVDLDVSAPAMTAAVGATTQFVASAALSDGSSVTVTSAATWASDTAAATVSAGGLVTAVAPGLANISASYTLNGVTKAESRPFVVTNPVTALLVTGSSGGVPAGLTQQLTAVAVFADKSTENVTSAATWKADSSGAVSVNEFGLVSLFSVGTATVTASYAGFSTDATVAISAEVLNSITVTASKLAVPVGLSAVFTATGNYTTGPRDITSSVTFSATPSGAFSFTANSGTATSAGPFPATASVSASLGQVISAPLSVTVIDAVIQSATISPVHAMLPVGGVFGYTVIGTFSSGLPQDLTNLATWTAAPSSVATVTNTGKRGVVRGISAGPATLTATFGSVTSEAVSLTIASDQVSSVTLTPANAPTLNIGDTAQFTATAHYQSGLDLDMTSESKWSAVDSGAPPSLITNFFVSPSGLVTGLSSTSGVSGGARVRAVVSGVSGYAPVVVHAPAVTSVAVSCIPPGQLGPLTCLPSGLGFAVLCTATATYDDSSQADVTSSATFSVSYGLVATPSSLIVVGSQTYKSINIVGAGTTVVTAQVSGVTSASSGTLGVSPYVVGGSAESVSSIAVSASSYTVKVGSTLGLTALAAMAGSGSCASPAPRDFTRLATWSSGMTNVATVAAGTVTGVAGGSSTITATFGSSSDNHAVTVE